MFRPGLHARKGRHDEQIVWSSPSHRCVATPPTRYAADWPRSALLSVVRGLSAEELEKQPTPAMWSVREALEHVMETEVALLAKLEKWPANEFATLQAVHRMAFQRFTVMDPEDTAIDHEIQGRRWSTRKVMRRILEHEYEHLGHIKEIVAALEENHPPE